MYKNIKTLQLGVGVGEAFPGVGYFTGEQKVLKFSPRILHTNANLHQGHMVPAGVEYRQRGKV